ncbi:MAG: hypothetical protein HN350_19235 [Phycisphaerales bacterium]|jgi:sialate O-acetylesterase|nr:hypothetical protein [Phycisphaerales bacterium]
MMTARTRKLSALVMTVVSLVGGAAFGEVRLAKIFTDHMVLQQEMPIAVWGWADKGEKVTVTLAGKSAEATTDASGKWRVDIPAMKADGKPQTLVVKGANTIELKDILLGEVWLCAGQSNMSRSTDVKDSDPQIRLFWIDGSATPLKEGLGKKIAGWVRSTPKDVAAAAPIIGGRFDGKSRKSFTEVGYVFGRTLHSKLKVPVGLIKCAYGGSQVQAWTPQPNVGELYPFGKPAEGGYLGHRPGLLYQAMVNGIVPLSMRGVIWYQGENDGRSKKYHTDLVKWIASWRKLWNRDDMPFYMVQIAPTTYAGGRMQYIWEAQAWAMHNIPNTALAVTNDMAPTTDSKGVDKMKVDETTGFPRFGGSNPHPSNKQLAGVRLANIALVKTYKRPARPLYGPMYDSHKIVGDKVIVKFKYAGDGLASRDGKPLNWFELSDGTIIRRKMVFAKATAKIVGKDTIEVAADGVKAPKFVRFAWNCEARHNLMNQAKLPAVSFKTNDPLK